MNWEYIYICTYNLVEFQIKMNNYEFEDLPWNLKFIFDVTTDLEFKVPSCG